MNLKCGSGASNAKNTQEALNEAITSAKKEGGIDEVTFASIYFTVGHDPTDLEKAIKVSLGDVPNCGCSGEGVIAKNFSIEGDSPGISVMLFAGDKIHFRNQIFENVSDNDFEVGHKIGEWAKKVDKKSKCVIIFTDGLSTNSSSLRDGITSTFSLFFKKKVFGGGAGDDLSMKKTYQIFNGKVYSNAVSVFSIGGKFKIAHAVNHGISPMGQEHIVTKVKDNIIYEIDGQKAFSALKPYLHDDEVDNWGKASAGLAVAFKAPLNVIESYDEYLVRFMIQPNEDGSLLISANAKEGDSIWISRRDLDKIDSGIIAMAERVNSKLKAQKPFAVLNFDCAGRGRVIMEESRKMKNLRYLQNELGASTPWAGFYTFGEFAPINNTNEFHSYTNVILALYT